MGYLLQRKKRNGLSQAIPIPTRDKERRIEPAVRSRKAKSPR
jgi:hypothetical protein